MKKYKLIKKSLVAGVLSVVLTTTGCENRINNNLDERYVAFIDDEVKLLEKEKTIGGDFFCYSDIITNEKYREFPGKIKNIDIRGNLVQFLSLEQIKLINEGEFNDDDWIELYVSIRNKYQGLWNTESLNKDKLCDVKEFREEEIKKFNKDYSEGLSSDDVYILDTSLANIGDIYEMGIKLDRYYLIVNNHNPINNSIYDEERLLFNNEWNEFSTVMWGNGYFRIELGNGISITNENREKAIFNINEFLENNDEKDIKKEYSILELTNIIEKFNEKEVEKISSDRVYVFDAIKSDINIIPVFADGDISSLEINNYYILIKNKDGRNVFDTLSNGDGDFINGDIYYNKDMILRSVSRNRNGGFIFNSIIDESYNFIPINDFLKSKGLGEYIEDRYSFGELNKLNWSLNELEVKNLKSRKLI